MANDVQDYGIGSQVWPGLAKVMEEMGELQQVLGKVMACDGPEAIYWDGSSLVPKIIEEVADVQAALTFFSSKNLMPEQRREVAIRWDEKLEKFEYWHQQYSRGDGRQDTLPLPERQLHDQTAVCIIDNCKGPHR